MSKDKKTEDLIKDKLDNRGFAFDEKNWAGMENLLDAQEKRKKRAFFWYFSASMLVVLVAGAVWFLNNQQSTVDNKLTIAQSSKIEENDQKTVRSNEKAAYFEEKEELNTKAIAEKAKATVENSKAITEIDKVTAEKAKATVENSKAIVENAKAITENDKATPENSDVILEKESENSEKALDSAKTPEQTPEVENNNPLTAPGKETKNAWGIVAGVGYWFPYQSTLGASTLKGGFPFTAGIYYQRTLSKRFELGLSILYSSRGALNFDRTFINTEFGFGIESDKTTVSPQTLHYINAPLYVRFNISQRSHLLIGASYYQLLATTSKYTHTTENSFGVVESSTEKQTGNHPGFRKNDIAAFIGYELTLFERMNVGLQFSYGFYDITDNNYNGTYDGSSYGDRNISLQLQLKYDLIRH